MWILVALVIAVILLGLVVIWWGYKTVNKKDKAKQDKRNIVKSYTKAYSKVTLKDGIKVHEIKNLNEHGKLMDWYHNPKKGGK